MMRSVLGAGVLLGVLALLVFLTSSTGGRGVYFTIVNRTDQPLYTWAFYENCGESPGNRQDYFRQVEVPVGETFRYSYDSPGPTDEVKCVQVTDNQRRLVLSERYERSATYVVTDPTPIDQKPVPTLERLPSQSWLDQRIEGIRENPGGSTFLAGVFFVFAIALPYGIFRAAKDLLRYRSEGAAQANEDRHD